MDDLIKEIVDATIKQNEAFEVGDSKIANEQAERCDSAFHELRSKYGDQGREALSRLFEHHHSAVRIMAAASLLRYCTDRAKAILEREAQGTGFAAFRAEQCLQRWKEGNWQLDPQR